MSTIELNKENYNSFKDLTGFQPDQLIKLFLSLPKAKTLWLLRSFEENFRNEFLNSAPKHLKAQWSSSLKYEANTVGELMQPAPLILNENNTIEEAISIVRSIPKQILFTYGMVVNDNNQLTGVLVFRDIFYHEPDEVLKDICFKDPLTFNVNEDVLDVFIKIAGKQIPEYPVLNDENEFIGLLRGSHVADSHALEVIAQSGILVGVSKYEALDTTWRQCIKLRGPWLLLNLVTAFVAGAVVGIFQDTIDQIVLLAMFLPVLAGQSGNTGAQALAVLIREMTLGDLGPRVKQQLIKEAILGVVHGFLVGMICAIVMYVIASAQNNPHVITLSIIILFSMTVSCLVSGLMGAVVPVVLKKMGADPAAGSSIILTTGTDVVSMGVMLYLANKFILGG
jgi:magnesium transporter